MTIRWFGTPSTWPSTKRRCRERPRLAAGSGQGVCAADAEGTRIPKTRLVEVNGRVYDVLGHNPEAARALLGQHPDMVRADASSCGTFTAALPR